jgi:hypothetical protein
MSLLWYVPLGDESDMSNGFFADPAIARSLLGPIPVGISLGKRRRVGDFTDAERTHRTSRLMGLLTAVYADSSASSSRVRLRLRDYARTFALLIPSPS